MSALEAWATSGGMALTGRRHGAPLVSPGDPAGTVRRALDRLGLTIPGLLGERAAYAGLGRRGPWSCGRSMRILPTADGHIALSLPRASDVELVPALVQGPVDDAWGAVTAWARSTTATEAEDRVRLLGLAGGAVATSPPTGRTGVEVAVLGRRERSERPLVVDLSGLWAGPLCAHLLGLRGATVVKVESVQRPDGARGGPVGFFELLHAGHERLTLDFGADLDDLRELLAGADLVLESSRPRALRHLGVVAEDVVAEGTSWLSITARGRASDAVGFGDDVSACAGLVVRDRGELLPVGDAIADPLTGVVAAVAAVDALASEEARLIDVSMLHVTAAVVGPVPAHETVRRDAEWWVEADEGRWPVREPRTRG
jgi:hypothetical protein